MAKNKNTPPIKYERLAAHAVRALENNTNALNAFQTAQKEMTMNVTATMSAMHESLKTVIINMQEREKIRMEAEVTRESGHKEREHVYQKYIVWLVATAILLAGGATVFQVASILSKANGG